jgi:hypothetical protein
MGLHYMTAERPEAILNVALDAMPAVFPNFLRADTDY